MGMGTASVEIQPAAGAGKRLEVKRHVQALIDTGALRRGARLPSILELSKSLDVAKNTVIGALDELCDEGVLEARERRGFFVRTARRDRAQKTRLADLAFDRVAHGMATILAETGDDFVPIGSGTTAESLLATPAWTAALRSAPPRDPLTSLRYADPMGEPRLREAIAARHGDESPARVVVTHGAVEALNLTFAAVGAETQSRRVGIESPGYFMLAPIVAGLGLVPVPIPRDLRGLDFDRLRVEARRAQLAGVMVNPNHHNPTGATLSLAARFELARLADEHRFWIIEDDVYKGLWTEAEEPPTIASLLPRRTLYVSSFSKTLGPALRIGTCSRRTRCSRTCAGASSSRASPVTPTRRTSSPTSSIAAATSGTSASCARSCRGGRASRGTRPRRSRGSGASRRRTPAVYSGASTSPPAWTRSRSTRRRANRTCSSRRAASSAATARAPRTTPGCA
jgi:DNA-binding transcriptional MocR family regulator